MRPERDQEDRSLKLSDASKSSLLSDICLLSNLYVCIVLHTKFDQNLTRHFLSLTCKFNRLGDVISIKDIH